MALVERLCQIDPDEPNGEPYERHIPYMPFVAGLFRVLDGAHTVQQVKAFWDMTQEDQAEFDTFVARITARETLQERMLAVEQLQAIMNYWELKDSPYESEQYNSVQDIRTALNNL